MGAAFGGARYQTTKNGKPIRFTGANFASLMQITLLIKMAVDADMEDLEGWMERMFRYGSE